MSIDPVTLQIASMAFTAMSTVGQMVGSYQQGKAQQGMAEYNAGIARNNAIMAERQAQDAEARGKTEEQRQRQKNSLILGGLKAQQAASGTELDSESNVGLMEDFAASGEHDALTIRSNAAREAWGARVQASNYQSEAAMQQASGAAAYQSGIMGVGTNLLTGAGSLSREWYKTTTEAKKKKRPEDE